MQVNKLGEVRVGQNVISFTVKMEMTHALAKRWLFCVSVTPSNSSQNHVPVKSILSKKRDQIIGQKLVPNNADFFPRRQ